MRALKAYAEAGMKGQSGLLNVTSDHGDMGLQRKKTVASKSGDSISLSEEAKELLISNQGGISVTPQDATYDQHGQVMRQIDTLQGELRDLANDFMISSESTALLGNVRNAQSQLAGLRAMV